MSALYPSLEDMKVGQMQQVQAEAAASYLSQQQSYGYHGAVYPSAPSQTYPGLSEPVPAMGGELSSAYPSLMSEYMGLRLEPPSGPLPSEGHMGVVPSGGLAPAVPVGSGSGETMIAPISGGDVGLARATVSHGVREVVCCKDEKGKVGMKLRDVDKGVFVQLVVKGSPAALAGIRFGDQILQINGENVAGYSGDKAMNLFKKATPQKITVALRDRPFERTVTLHKDSSGHMGFTYKANEIRAIAKDGSAARNGLLTEHHILEINGQNVIGLKDKEVQKIVDDCGAIVTLTIMPSYVYEHMVKKMSGSLLKEKMDHSIPDVC